jgi:hypothetical protein
MPRTPRGFNTGTSGTSRTQTGTSRPAQGSGVRSYRSMAYTALGTSGTSGTSFARFRVCARDGVWGDCSIQRAKPVSVRRLILSSLTSLTSLNGQQAIDVNGLSLLPFFLSDVPENQRDVPDIPDPLPPESTGGDETRRSHNILRKAA